MLRQLVLHSQWPLTAPFFLSGPGVTLFLLPCGDSLGPFSSTRRKGALQLCGDSPERSTLTWPPALNHPNSSFPDHLLQASCLLAIFPQLVTDATPGTGTVAMAAIHHPSAASACWPLGTMLLGGWQPPLSPLLCEPRSVHAWQSFSVPGCSALWTARAGDNHPAE